MEVMGKSSLDIDFTTNAIDDIESKSIIGVVYI